MGGGAYQLRSGAPNGKASGIDLAESVPRHTPGRAPLRLVFINAAIAGPQHQSVDAAIPQEIGVLMYTNAVAPIRTLQHPLHFAELVAYSSGPTGLISFALLWGLRAAKN